MSTQVSREGSRFRTLMAAQINAATSGRQEETTKTEQANEDTERGREDREREDALKLGH
jgi:hypothetical protein